MNIKNTLHLTEQEVALCAEVLTENLPDKIPSELRQHLGQCDQCAAEVAMVADIADLDVQLDVQNAQPNVKESAITGWMIPLLAAALLLGFVIWVLYPSTEKLNGHETMLAAEQALSDDEDIHDESNDAGFTEEDLETALFADSLPKETVTDSYKDTIEDKLNPAREPEKLKEAEPKQTLLASYIPHPDMEMLFENFQSAYRGSAVRVKSPAVVSLSEHTELVWDNPEGKSLLVVISDNEGNEIFSAITNSSSVEIPSVLPGLYYWRLIEAEDFDLLFVGKILSED